MNRGLPHLRELAPSDDHDAIAAMVVDSWRSSYRGILHQEFLDQLTGARWLRLLDEPDYQSQLLVDGSRCVGMVVTGPVRDPELAGWGEICSCYLAPEYWGHGFGGRLFDAGRARLDAQGFTNQYLWVFNANQRARGFYEHRGFQPGTQTHVFEAAGRPVGELTYVREGLGRAS